MTLTYGDRVQEIFTTTGTGTVSLGGAVTGYQPFSAVMSNSGTCYYCATDGTNWEVGLGTYTTSGNTLARTTILSSSNSGSAVSWAAGTKNIWLDFPAIAIPGASPLATLLAPGTVQPDGSTILISAGVVSVPTGTTSALGLLQPDGSTILVSGGVISIPTSTSSQFGVVKPDNSTITSSGGVLTATPPAASLMTALAVGSVIFALNSRAGGGTTSAGSSVAASNLTAAMGLQSSTAWGSSGDSISGTWRALGTTVYGGASNTVGLFQRIA